ncbi:eukaryotic cytochrome b561-domain-containing protein [Ampelomyces quisqualis]|uniref:Eukaryotic cytochrome b561-domain-containing protein n=1 Tax=Ampelomyces quisqualis TaxID=50730 RepID=A0A6A5QKV0_AMPQU|nr:eukaryotic cytochrome b561-domain-containing protein [Ampelomyces quisqualis]
MVIDDADNESIIAYHRKQTDRTAHLLDMASATGIPNAAAARGQSEEEPLLGRRGDASQAEGQALWYNLWIGTAPIAQAGIWILAAIIWGAILSHKLIFFSAHPLLNSAGFLLAIQAALLLQPTHTPRQKKAGTLAHALVHLLGTSALTAGLVVIEINKAGPGHDHFSSPHARLGLAFYVLVYVQSLVGFTQYYAPRIYGGPDHAKAVYKYHRLGGYVIALLGLATLCAASWTTYSLNVAHVQHWAVIVASVLVLVGVVPRIRLSKFGLRRDGEVRL